MPRTIRSGALALALSLALAACGGGPAGDGSTAGCGPVEHPPEQGGGHLIGDAEPPVPYVSTPATSGWHDAGAPRYGWHDEPLSEPRQVTVLELGGVVVTYGGSLSARDEETLRAIVDDHPETVAVTPYTELDPGSVALTAWTTLQACDAVDEQAIRAFIADHADSPPTHKP